MRHRHNFTHESLWVVTHTTWGLNFCLQISCPLSGLACRLFRSGKCFPRSDPPSKILYRFLTVRFAQCLSFGIRHSFELIATERIAKVVPFRMETRAWPVVTWGELNIAIPIKARSTFWFYKSLCKENMSLQGGVSHFTALTWKLDQSSRLEKKKQNKNTSYADKILLANPYWHYSCNFTVTESSRDNENLLYCPSAS